MYEHKGSSSGLHPKQRLLGHYWCPEPYMSWSGSGRYRREGLAARAMAGVL